jgi:RNA polymerase-binding transcription factor DksA
MGAWNAHAGEQICHKKRAAAARAIVEEIDQALAKIPKKTYGICETSGLAIPKERLRAIPWARERVEVKTRAFG